MIGGPCCSYAMCSECRSQHQEYGCFVKKPNVPVCGWCHHSAGEHVGNGCVECYESDYEQTPQGRAIKCWVFCPWLEVPAEFNKISEYAWNYINYLASLWAQDLKQLSSYGYATSQEAWEIRGWFITYLMNPSPENKAFLIDRINDFEVLDNLEVLRVFQELSVNQRKMEILVA